MLTQERANVISQYLEADQERAKELLALEPADAAKKMNADGNDFTVNEIIDYGKALKVAVSKDELGAEDLDSVAGGVVTVSVGIMAACAIGGFAAGFVANKSW